MSALKAKRPLKQKVEERAKAGICLLDDCGLAAECRGLCKSHSVLFYVRVRSRPSKQAQADFEDECIREGLVLPLGQQRILKRNDPFSKVSAG